MFTATLRVRLGSCLSTALKMDNLDSTKINTHFKIHSLSTGGAHSRLLVHIVSPTSPPYVGTQLTALFHTQPLLKCPFYGIAAPGKLHILVKAQPAPQAPGHCHQLGLAYGRETWVYPTNTLAATVAFLLLPDTNLLPQAGITHYSQRVIPTLSIPTLSIPTLSIPTLSIPTSSIPIWSTSHFLYSHFVNSHLVNVDKAGIDKVGIDEVGS